VRREQDASRPILILLGLLIFTYHFGNGIYYFRGLEPLPSFEFLYTAGFLCGVVWWLRVEARTSAIKTVYCLGLFVGMGWPIMIPYHLLKTRGVRGLVPLFGLIGSFLVAYILAAVVNMVFWT
jgi:hypothetical protein